MRPGNRIILNTGILYAKMLISIVVGLISTRLVLKALGTEDYGIYNLIFGMVSMLAFLNTSLTASTQRFMSYSLGEGNAEKLRKVFYYSLILHTLIGVCVILLIESIGIFCIKNVLVIDVDKLHDALTILHLLSISVCFTIVSIPYCATFVNRENMLFLSVIEIVESVSKLGGVIFLLYFEGNRLILYSFIVVCATSLSLLLRIIICYFKYEETRFRFVRLSDRQLLKDMTSYAGWYTFASIGNIGRFQGIPMVMNVFFGVIVNTAYGIANQVNGLMQFFAKAILQSIVPQIIQSEGANDRDRVKRLSMIACKYMFYLCAFFSIPLIIEMPFVLHVWLGAPPDYAIGFCRLVLLSTLLSMITGGLEASIAATGKIKLVYIIIGILHFLNLPVGYFLLKMGFSAYSMLWVVVVEELVCMCVRVYFAERLVGINHNYFTKHIILPVVFISSITFAFGFIVSACMQQSFQRFVLCCIMCALTFVVLSWYYGIEGPEKIKLLNIVDNIKVKFKRVGKCAD